MEVINLKKELKILSATAILGYGFPEDSFKKGMEEKPDLIAADAGSSDPGPYYLGSGESFTDRAAVKRDLEIMITAGIKNKIPVVIGTAGGSGANPHLNWCIDIVKEIADEKSLHFKLGTINSELDSEFILNQFEANNIVPLEPAPKLTVEEIKESSHIVGQMGSEPFEEALQMGANVVLAGRAYDPVIFASLPIMKGYDQALALHLGKILECASIATTPGSGSDCMMGYLGEDYFRLEPVNPIRKCTTTSVSAHTLYEKTNPYILRGPGGDLDLTECTFEQTTDRMVTVRGSKFVPSKENAVKLEGAKCIGYRTVCVAGVRDPIFIKEIDPILEGVEERVKDNFKDKNFEYTLKFIIYGRNGVMGELEPRRLSSEVHELGIIIEAIAETQESADTICSFARSTMLHFGYNGRKATAGNLALPYSPSDFHAGKVYVWSVYHLLLNNDSEELFKVEIIDI